MIAEQGTVSKAAKTLRLGQPTLSAQLKLFEDTLGIPLFERKKKRLHLTEQGRLALDYAKQIFRMGGEMVEVLNDRLRPNRMTFHVGALDSIAKEITLRLVQFAYKTETCQITLSEGKPDELLRELSAHRMDLILLNHLPTGVDAKGLIPKSILKKNITFYGAPQYQTLRKNFPQSISGAPLIFPTYDSRLRYDLDHWARLHEIELNIVAETQDISMKRMMALHGLGLIATSSHAITEELKSKKLVEIGQLKGVYEELYLLGAQRKIPHPIGTQLLKNFSL